MENIMNNIITSTFYLQKYSWKQWVCASSCRIKKVLIFLQVNDCIFISPELKTNLNRILWIFFHQASSLDFLLQVKFRNSFNSKTVKSFWKNFFHRKKKLFFFFDWYYFCFSQSTFMWSDQHVEKDPFNCLFPQVVGTGMMDLKEKK